MSYVVFRYDTKIWIFFLNRILKHEKIAFLTKRKEKKTNKNKNKTTNNSTNKNKAKQNRRF